MSGLFILKRYVKKSVLSSVSQKPEQEQKQVDEIEV